MVLYWCLTCLFLITEIIFYYVHKAWINKDFRTEIYNKYPRWLSIQDEWWRKVEVTVLIIGSIIVVAMLVVFVLALLHIL